MAALLIFLLASMAAPTSCAEPSASSVISDLPQHLLPNVTFTHTPMRLEHHTPLNPVLHCGLVEPELMKCEQLNVEIAVSGAVPDDWNCLNLPDSPVLIAERFAMELELPRDIILRVLYQILTAILPLPYSSWIVGFIFILALLGCIQTALLLCQFAEWSGRSAAALFFNFAPPKNTQAAREPLMGSYTYPSHQKIML